MLLASLMGETASRARERIQQFSESGNRDSDEVGEVAALARFSISLLKSARCRTSEQRTGGEMDGVKRRRRITTQPPFPSTSEPSLESAENWRSGLWSSSRRSQLAAVSVKRGGVVSPVEKRSDSRRFSTGLTARG